MRLQFVLLVCLILVVVEEPLALCEGAQASAVIIYVNFFFFVFTCCVRSEKKQREIMPYSQCLRGSRALKIRSTFCLS